MNRVFDDFEKLLLIFVVWYYFYNYIGKYIYFWEIYKEIFRGKIVLYV